MPVPFLSEVVLPVATSTGPPVGGSPKTGQVHIDSNGIMWVYAGSTLGWVSGPVAKNLVYSISGTLSVKTGTQRLYPWTAMTMISVRASLGTAPKTSSCIIDVLKNGTSIFASPSSRPTIATGQNTNLVTLLQGTDTTALSTSDYLTINVVQVDSFAANLTVQVTAQ